MSFHKKTPFGLLLAGLVAAPALLSLPGCGSKQQELPTNSKDTETAYRTDTVQLRNLSQDLRFTGKVSYDQRRVDQVFPVVSGTVLNVSANLGQRVTQGQALATVQSADVSGYLNDYNAARSDFALAKRTADNTEQLYKTNFASQSDLIAAREGLTKAQSTLNRSQQILKLYGAGTGSAAQPVYQVKAPVGGYVVARNVNQNMQLRPDNSTPLFTISDLSRVWILLNVYETDVANVKVGEPVDITVLAYPDKKFNGTITNISNVVDPDTRIVQARVELANPDGLLKPDMFCTVYLHNKEAAQNLAVSPRAVIFNQDKYYVVKQTSPGKYAVVPVQVVRTTSQFTYVSGKLNPSDQVVTEGSLLLFNDLMD